jgi:sulfur carrier protein
MMNVIVNNNSQSIKEESSVQTMAAQLKIESKGIAIAINQTVISKSDWSIIQLKENDNITIIKATQGG